MPTKWAGLSLRQNEDPLRVCCCCIVIEVFKIGLSLVLRLRVHLLLYYKVQQQIEMDELVSNIHPVSRSNWSYYNHHHRCCCCSDSCIGLSLSVSVSILESFILINMINRDNILLFSFIVCWFGGFYRLHNILFHGLVCF